MKFEEGEIYLDREGNEYRYLSKAGGVIKFEDLKTSKTIAQHESGRYRWDNQDNSRDIITEAK